MWKCDAINTCSKNGQITRIITERYLRDDIICFSSCCNICTPSEYDLNVSNKRLSSTPYNGKYLLPDTQVCIKQMDILESCDIKEISNIIICETVLLDVRKHNLGIYNRLLQLIKSSDRNFILFSNEHHKDTFINKNINETIQEKNDRSIIKCVKWYENHLKYTTNSISILFLTNNEISYKKAKLEGILNVQTIETFIRPYINKYPNLIDKLVHDIDNNNNNNIEEPTNKRKKIFNEHLTLSEITNGIKNKKYYKGMYDGKPLKGFVRIRGLYNDNDMIKVNIIGIENINRSISGDIVAIQILPKNQWSLNNKNSKISNDKENIVPDDELLIELNNDNDGPMEVPDTTLPSEEVISNNEHDNNVPCGKVVGIIQRNWKSYAGSLKINSNMKVFGTYLYFEAVNRSIPYIKIQTKQKDILSDKRFVVTIDSWPIDSLYPIGHYVRTIGVIGDKETETQVILHEHDIPTSEFSDRVMACLPPSDWKITIENSKGRTDLRHLPVMSIDPPGCKDIDDALHYRLLPNGKVEIGVHIADVTHFVHAGTPIDIEASNRGTSTYLVDRRLDMLPSLLTTDLCSLKGGEDRFAFSVIWEIKYNKKSNEIDIIKVNFFKTIIHSIAALSYNEAQILLDDPSQIIHSEKDKQDINKVCGDAIKNLFAISRILYNKRQKDGALTLASPEVRFKIDTETQNPLDVQMYESKDTNSLVEEMMLLANQYVGKQILKHFPTFSLLRRHASPKKEQFDDLLRSANAIGVRLNIDTSKDLADSLDKAVKSENPYFNKMLRILTTRCMMPAQYICSGEYAKAEYHHYGIAAPIYTHFTSPIRRYADVIVHRLLASSIKIAPLPVALEDKLQLSLCADALNRRNKAAQDAGRASVTLHTIIYFKNNPIYTDGLISIIKQNGIVIHLPRFGIEGMVRLLDNTNESIGLYNEKKQTLTLRSPDNNNSMIFKMFNKLKVKVFVEKNEWNREELIIKIITNKYFSKVALNCIVP